MTAGRFILLVTVVLGAAVGFAAGGVDAASPKGAVPLPLPRPASKVENKTLAAHKGEARSASSRKAHSPAGPPVAVTESIGPAPLRLNVAPRAAPMEGIPPRPMAGISAPLPAPAAPLALATTAATSPLDLSAVKQAIDLVRRGQQDEATSIEATISDPLARKLVEWVILHSDNGSTDFNRYAAFIAANPSWPSIITLRRHAEAVLWQQHVGPQPVIAFFRSGPPGSAKGRFALARALLAEGDHAGAQAAVSEAWRHDGFSAELEAQAREEFADLITPADDFERMEARLDEDDADAGLRAAQHLDGMALAIAKARAAVINGSANAKALLDAVPAAAQHDPGYMLSRIQWLRRTDKIPEAAQWIMAAPRDPSKLGDLDQWWIERRIVARKLLDLRNAKLAYAVANGAAVPANENYRADQQFTAGWIALRFLHEPAVALAHFARIADGTANPITLARAFYWQGRAAEALGREQDAREYYQAAARYPTAYYGQLARVRLGHYEVALRDVPDPPANLRLLEVARAFEILYAIDERDFVATMAADLADKATDEAALVTLAEIATRHHDARATLLIGKAALGRGFPLERYAFPAFGVPDYQPVGPAVERCVIYSIVRQESAFNTRAVSSARALGLMQVTPEAGRAVAQKFNVTFDQRRLLDDVAYNAQIGAAELGEVISDYRGSYILAFASYNAGRHRVKEWIDQYGDPRNAKVDPVDWIERIPFAETRNYVERVIENMQVYRARIDNDPRLLIEPDLHRGS
ncbi:MAG TPA: lytic transglycosylase domain-containing protein [Xanthobacteraceae bacterium]